MYFYILMKDETHLLDCNITPTLSEYLNSPPVFSDVRGVRSLVFCVMFVRPIVLVFFGGFLAIGLSVFLRFTASDCPCGILDLQLLIAPVVS